MEARTEQFLREMHTMLSAICGHLGIELDSPLADELFRERYAQDFMALISMGYSEDDARRELDVEVARERDELAERRAGQQALLAQALAQLKANQPEAKAKATKKEAISG